MKYDLVIFDMDGTILDTLDDLTAATNYALQKKGLPHDFSRDRVKLCFGCGIYADMVKSLAMAAGADDEEIEGAGDTIPLSRWGFTEKDAEELRDIFSPYYSAHNRLKTAPYPGIPELIRTLRAAGVRTAVASNKDEADVKKLAGQLFPGLFDTVIGNSPAISRKPAPDMINAIRTRWDVSREKTLYIGDSEVDLETAKNGGVDCLCVNWGFRTEDFLRRHGAERIISRAEEIEAFCR